MILIREEACVIRCRFFLNAAAMATVISLGVPARAADMQERSQGVLELQPGMTKIIPVQNDHPVQAIVIGNPNIADASAINLRAIAVTGKGAGLTSFILFDAEGNEISNMTIQVVGADAYIQGKSVKKRREVRVISTWKGPSSPNEAPDDRRYLCAENCSAVQVEQPHELNPPGNTSAAVGTTTIQKIISSSTSPSAIPLPH